jgi:hypothetical protein
MGGALTLLGMGVSIILCRDGETAPSDPKRRHGVEDTAMIVSTAQSLHITLFNKVVKNVLTQIAQ